MTRAQLTQTLLLALAPLAACGRTEDEITDWTLLSKAGAAGSAGKAGSGGGVAKAGAGGTISSGGSAGAPAGSAGSAGVASGGMAGVSGAGGATSIVCINGITMPFGDMPNRRCFEPFEGECPEIGLGFVQPELPELCGITCQFGGPVPPEPGDPGKCCYLVEEVCEGRPLFVGGRLVTARLVMRGGWALGRERGVVARGRR